MPSLKESTLIANVLENCLPDIQCLSGDVATFKFGDLFSAIRVASTEGHRKAASKLINNRYAWRGYGSGFTVDESPGQMTLVATVQPQGTPIGTLTVRLDSRDDGLMVDELYHPEAQLLRSGGHRLCEIVKFAVEGTLSCVQLLGSLFHIGFIYAHRLNRCTDVLIEVTPQHSTFYRRLLHFEAFGEERLNPRVNTRGVLLRLDLEHAAQQISQYGGRGGQLFRTSAYAYAFSPKEERAIQRRMTAEAAEAAA